MRRHFLLLFVFFLRSSTFLLANSLHSGCLNSFQDLLQDSNVYKIKGTIFSSDTKNTVPFVTIFTDDKKIVSQSDKNGHFEFELPKTYFSRKTIISFSCTGYKELKMKFRKRYTPDDYKIYLQPIVSVLY